MTLTTRREAGRLVFQVSKALFEKDAIFAATYELSGLCRNRIEPGPDEDHVTVTLEPIDAPEGVDLDKLEHRFLTEMVDQQLRLDLERRYGGLRQLIIQHAFSPLGHLKEEVKKTVGRD